MDATKEARLEALTEELAALLYAESDPKKVKTLSGIEETVCEHLLKRVGPAIGNLMQRYPEAFVFVEQLLPKFEH